MNEFNNAFAKLLYNILSYLFSALQHDGRILTSEGHHLRVKIIFNDFGRKITSDLYTIKDTSSHINSSPEW
ncbi:unnamed protein product [Rhizophagus irregularis]|nr:unnamed protein product [Rhizophagus irregularis]